MRLAHREIVGGEVEVNEDISTSKRYSDFLVKTPPKIFINISFLEGER